MELTPEVLRAAYSYLSETEPFHDWNMPDAEDIKFQVRKDRKLQGNCRHRYYKKTGETKYLLIQIAEKWVYTSNSLISTMAHEMIHAHMFWHNIKERAHHGETFQAFAKEVCELHGFDPGQF
jgi:predicted SprT family Zn-dependent metalloprotease